MNKSHKITIAIVSAVALGIVTGAFAFDVIRAGSTPVRWPDKSQPVPYLINSKGSADINDGSDIEEIKKSFDEWAKVECSSLTIKYAGETTSAQASMYDNKNILYWIESNWPADIGSNTIGVTTPAFTYAGAITDADIRFNGQNFCWSTKGARNCMDVANIATHEIGHFFGLGHEPNIFDATMYPAGSQGEVIRATLHQDDINGLCFLYPAYNGTLGSPCDAQRPCNSAYICATHGSRTVCSSKCSMDSSCPSGFTCNTSVGACVPKSNVGTGGTAPSGGGGTTGAGTLCSSCRDGSDCNSGICVQGPSLTICTQVCDTKAQNCPSGYTCYSTQSGDGVCYPTDGQCPPGGSSGGGDDTTKGDKGYDCGADGYCKTGLVCVGTSYADAKCHNTCKTNADCESDEACYTLQDQNGNLLDYGACVYVGGGGGGGTTDAGTPGTDAASLPGLDERCLNRCEGKLICVTIKPGQRYCKVECNPAQKICSDGSYCKLSPEGYGYCTPEEAPDGDEGGSNDDSSEDAGTSTGGGGGGSGSGSDMPSGGGSRKDMSEYVNTEGDSSGCACRAR